MTNPTTVVAYGCSFTEGSELGDSQFITSPRAYCTPKNKCTQPHIDYIDSHSWPSLIASMVGAKCINYGWGGSGNDVIASDIFSTLPDIVSTVDDPTDVLVVVCWSQLQRLAVAQNNITNRLVPGIMPSLSVYEFQSLYHFDDTTQSGKWLLDKTSNFMTGVWNHPNNTIFHFLRILCGVVDSLKLLGVRWYMCWAMTEHPHLYGLEEFDNDMLNYNDVTNRLLKAVRDRGVSEHWFNEPQFSDVRNVLDCSQASFHGMTERMKYPVGKFKHPLELAHQQWAIRLYGAMVDHNILDGMTSHE